MLRIEVAGAGHRYPRRGTMRPFVFSCDAHIAEPLTLFLDRMPAHLQQFAIHSKSEGSIRSTMVGETVALKIQNDFHGHKTGCDNHDPALASINMADREGVDTKRRGARDLELRLADMDKDGVDEELVFPSLGLMLPCIPHREGQKIACEIWAQDLL
jgi:hypothetical protein